MDAVTIILLILCIVAMLTALDARLQLSQLKELHEKDGRYFEWWLRSLEERKVDRELIAEEDSDDY